MKAIKKQVLVQLDARVEVSSGGIAIPDACQRPEVWGKVVSVGDECKFLSEGDKVYVPSLQGTRFEIDGKDMIFILESKILAFKTQ